MELMSATIAPALAGQLHAAQSSGDRWAEATAIRALARAIRKPDFSRKATALQSFWPRVAFGASECWIWTGGIDELGYGRTGRKLQGEVTAHRAAYRIFKGDIPRHLEVMHSCDVRCCVNPEHLSLGTHADNMQDCARKGRHGVRNLSGERNGMAKLTREAVAEMRRLKSGGVKQIDIARRFNVSPMTVSRAVRGESWR